MAAPARAPASETEIEVLIGETTAAAAAALAQALQEHWKGKLSSRTKTNGGDLVAALYELKQATAEEIVDFDATARVMGARALAARCNGGGYPSVQGSILIDETLRILNQVTETMAN
jgi:hypothetical protein